MVKIHLYNGAETTEAWNEDSEHFVDDWKPEERTIEAEAFQITYGHHIKVYLPDGEMISLGWNEEGFLVYDGVYFGDISISSVEEN